MYVRMYLCSTLIYIMHSWLRCVVVVGAEGLILRNLVTAVSDGSSCPYSKDIIAADGSRTLVRALPQPGPHHHRNPLPHAEEGGVGTGIDGGDSIASSEENNSVTAEEKESSDDVSNLNVNLQLLPEFHRDLLSGAPSTWRYVRLGADGSVLFFTCPPGASPEPKGIPHPSMKSIVDTKIDAESKCQVSTYKDGTYT